MYAYVPLAVQLAVHVRLYWYEYAVPYPVLDYGTAGTAVPVPYPWLYRY
eukprot:COSAG01_NODE_4682_length_4820_cov_8.720822_3_plen_49_part_00